MKKEGSWVARHFPLVEVGQEVVRTSDVIRPKEKVEIPDGLRPGEAFFITFAGVIMRLIWPKNLGNK